MVCPYEPDRVNRAGGVREVVVVVVVVVVYTINLSIKRIDGRMDGRTDGRMHRHIAPDGAAT